MKTHVLKIRNTSKSSLRGWKRNRIMGLYKHRTVRRAASAALNIPQLGGHAVTGAQNSVQSPLSPSTKVSTPQIEIWSTINQWSWGAFWKKNACTLYYFGPFEQGIFTLQLLLGGGLWKQSSLPIHYSCSWAPLKPRYFTHYNCDWGALKA